MADNLLEIRDLKTWFHTEDQVVRAVDLAPGTTIALKEGHTLGVVGESGSGKSVTAMTIMQLLPPETARIHAGTVSFLGKDIVRLPRSQMRAMRGRDIGMIFQEPMTSLNPVFRVGDQVMEPILIHEKISREEARERVLQLFREVDIPDPERRIDSYPHEMSGGQKQRVMIAMALSCNPKLLIADEPTTALDVTIQKQILDLLRRLRDERGMSILFITHDLGVIAEIADDVAVMFQGHLVEYGDVLDIYSNPQHPYTRSLLACRPSLDTTYKRLPTTSTFMDWKIDEDHQLVVTPKQVDADELEAWCMRGRDKLTAPEGDPLLSVRDLRVWFPIRKGVFSRVHDYVRAVDDVSFDVWRGQTLGLVGESGCGKTTTGRALLRLIENKGGTRVEGEAFYEGRDLFGMGSSAFRAMRRRMQIIFQDPYSSLNPRMTVGDMISEPMEVHKLIRSRSERTDRVAELLVEVGLKPEHMNRYPHEFSGGQRQRISIARALALEPEFLVCDESVSALDVSVQAQVLNLLKDLQEARSLTYIFISHDLSVVKFMSDTMAVMKAGKIVEMGVASEIYENPQEAYTRRLIDAVPSDDLGKIRQRKAERAERRAAGAE
ncbi:MAG: ABC transporter ATP-binding protein [Planctomycetes bacterium]|nr:ABC transporter ATP-binding protein [Planctomycetota bacterium]MCB9829403.1 ABC transporter ATP-binding protein [Planctomycetota bacterium]